MKTFLLNALAIAAIILNNLAGQLIPTEYAAALIALLNAVAAIIRLVWNNSQLQQAESEISRLKQTQGLLLERNELCNRKIEDLTTNKEYD
nr:MAG: hypothetical protein [Microviridae sp.]